MNLFLALYSVYVLIYVNDIRKKQMKKCKECSKKIKSDEPFVNYKLHTVCVPCFKNLYPEEFEDMGYCPTEEV